MSLRDRRRRLPTTRKTSVERECYLTRDGNRNAIGACMASIYNSSLDRQEFAKVLGKCGILLLLFGAAGGSISCRKAATAPVDRAAQRPTSEVLAETDALYRERADVVKVRQAIVALRQAQA